MVWQYNSRRRREGGEWPVSKMTMVTAGRGESVFDTDHQLKSAVFPPNPTFCPHATPTKTPFNNPPPPLTNYPHLSGGFDAKLYTSPQTHYPWDFVEQSEPSKLTTILSSAPRNHENACTMHRLHDLLAHRTHAGR